MLRLLPLLFRHRKLISYALPVITDLLRRGSVSFEAKKARRGTNARDDLTEALRDLQRQDARNRKHGWVNPDDPFGWHKH